MVPHQLLPGQAISIAKLRTEPADADGDRKQCEARFKELRDELIELQQQLYVEGRRKLLVVLQAMDTGGKDGTIRDVFKGVNPQGVHVTSFKTPSAEDLARDFLYRVHKAVPPVGTIGIFNRSHYEDVLIVRVEELAPEEVWRARYDQINGFEKYLVQTGTVILKFFLHISKDEQRKRLEDRLKKPDKQWKFSVGDVEKRKLWDRYMEAYEEALARCTTEWAPWHVIPSDKKWYRNFAVAQTIVSALQAMKIVRPEPSLPEPGYRIV